jgi:hypothetical protein
VCSAISGSFSLMQRRETLMHADANRSSPVNRRSNGRSIGRPCDPPCGPSGNTASSPKPRRKSAPPAPLIRRPMFDIRRSKFKRLRRSPSRLAHRLKEHKDFESREHERTKTRKKGWNIVWKTDRELARCARSLSLWINSFAAFSSIRTRSACRVLKLAKKSRAKNDVIHH